MTETTTASSEEDEQHIEFGTLAPQLDESHYDHRLADDDEEEEEETDDDESSEDEPSETGIRFPTHKLYGRDKEFQQLQEIVSRMMAEAEEPLVDENNTEATPETTTSVKGPNVVLLSGYSGSGKRTLVEALVRYTRIQAAATAPTQRRASTTKTTSPRLAPFPNYINGEFPRSTGGGRADNPFFVISQAINEFVVDIIYNDKDKDENTLKRLGQCFLDQGILDRKSEDAQILSQTLIPSFPQLLQLLTRLVPLPPDDSTNKSHHRSSLSSISSMKSSIKSTPSRHRRNYSIRNSTALKHQRRSIAIPRPSSVERNTAQRRSSSIESRRSSIVGRQTPQKQRRSSSIDSRGRRRSSIFRGSTTVDRHSQNRGGGRKGSFLESITHGLRRSVAIVGLPSFDSSHEDIPETPATEASPLSDNSSIASSVVHRNWHVMQYALIKLLRALTDFINQKGPNKKTKPLMFIWFLEDLQFMDKMSHQLMQALMNDKVLRRRILWIGSFTPNYAQTSTDGPFARWKEELEEGLQKEAPSNNICQYHHVPLSNISPDSVEEFIADSLGSHEEEDKEEISQIAQAIYSKTLGNMFFVKQALLELSRQNAIYYDVVTFAWRFVGVSLDEILVDTLSHDVGDMLQAKLQALPAALQLSLAVAAYSRHSFDIEWLYPLVKSQFDSYQMRRSQHSHGTDETGSELSTFESFQKLMSRALKDGLILPDHLAQSQPSYCPLSGSDEAPECYRFVHERMREAACNSIPEGEERNLFLLDLSTSLLQQAERKSVASEVAGEVGGQNDWMLFAASTHLNSLPASLINIMQSTNLSLKVGKMAKSKGSFSNAAVYFRSGIDRLVEANVCWEDPYYEISLDLYNHLLECEHVLGNMKEMEAAIQQVYSHAKTLPDKLQAQYLEVYSKRGVDNDRYTDCVDAGLEMLSLYGIKVPANPTDTQVSSAKMKMVMLLRGRSIACISKFPISTDPDLVAPLKLAQITLRYAALCHRHSVSAILSRRVLMLVLLKKGITLNVAVAIATLAGPFRREEKYEKMADCLSTYQNLMDLFSDDNDGKEYIMSKFTLYSGFICLQTPFQDTIPTFVQLTRDLIGVGEVDPGLGAGMQSILAPFLVPLPLALLEQRLVRLIDIAANLRKRSFVVFFSMFRQFLHNMQGTGLSSSTPTVFDGRIFDERSQVDAAAKKHHMRDTLTFRLVLAVIFNDTAAMTDVLEKLDAFPVFDMMVPREHVRMCYVGIASLILAQKSKSDSKLKKWGTTCTRFFEKLTRYGSPNAEPVYVCLQALSKPSAEAFEDAIEFLDGEATVHLSAIMHERYALWQMEQTDSSKILFDEDQVTHVDYLKRALGLYNDWGARAKVDQMTEVYNFLPATIEEGSSSMMFTAVARSFERTKLSASITAGAI